MLQLQRKLTAKQQLRGCQPVRHGMPLPRSIVSRDGSESHLAMNASSVLIAVALPYVIDVALGHDPPRDAHDKREPVDVHDQQRYEQAVEEAVERNGPQDGFCLEPARRRAL